MSEPIDIKTKKKLSPSTEINFDKEIVLEIVQNSLVKTYDEWVKFQQTWVNKAYATFHDFDKYLVLIYLIKTVWQDLSDKFKFQSIDEFYSHDQVIIPKINLIKISEELNIPKETIRRKVNDFQKVGILRREGKSIILNRSLMIFQKPTSSLDQLCKFIEKTSALIPKEKLFNKNYSREEYKIFICKHFTVCWSRFFNLQIPYLVRNRNTFRTLETWNIWGTIAINHMINVKKMDEKRLLDENIMPNNFVDQLINVKIKHGINASTISDMSGIPRATVIRKLKWLTNQNVIKKDKNLQYFMTDKGKLNKQINKNISRLHQDIAYFLTDIIDLIKNSNLKI